MKNKMTLQQRLRLPIILLGLVTLLSNILAVFSIHNVNANAGTIVDNYMVSETQLEDIRHSMMNIHRLALSHIVAADHATMIQLVQEIKEEEALLDEKLADYEAFIAEEDLATYRSLLGEYDSFKHALVDLVCASADSRTQEAYACANGDVAAYSNATEENISALYASVSQQAENARNRLSIVYLVSLVTSAVTLLAGILLMMAAFRIIQKSVIVPIQDAIGTLKGSSERLSGVVGDVRTRTQSSSDSVRALSRVTDQLSAALEEIASSASVIRASSAGTQSDTANMAQECTAINAYSVDMRRRAEEMERAAQEKTEDIQTRTNEILSVLDEAIKKSQSVNQIATLTKDILSISASTDLIAINASIEATRAGAAGKGFAIVAREIRQLADSCSQTANHIKEVSTVVTGAVDYLAKCAQELVDFLSSAVLAQFEQSVRSGQQYRNDAAYIEDCIEGFNSRVEHLRAAMNEIACSISNISDAIEGAASGVSGAAGSTRSLVDDMAGITGRMHANQEIVGELKKQMDVFANL